jgi:hypothetical protein
MRDGSITVAFRRWARSQVVVGRPYRTPAGRIEVDAVDVVDPEAVTDDDARAAGHADAAALLASFGDGPPLHRIRFHLLDEPDPRDVLADDDDLDEAAVAAIRARLQRLDRAAGPRAGGDGPWTTATLAAIAERPGVRAGDLAADLGRERLAFKADVRKLKAIGLTRSLPVGYELSPRGAAYVARAGGRERSDGRGDGCRG